MSRERPGFSVVVPAHNAARTLRSCIRSVLAQTDPSLEVVVVDDGSSDATLEVAEGFADSRVIAHSQAPQGVSAARNAGILAARGEVVCFLDSDDLLLPHYLATVGRILERDAGIDFVYTDAWTFDDTTRRVRRNTTAHYQHPPRPAPADAAGMFQELVQRNFIIVPVAVRRDALMAAGRFDTSMSGCEDWDLWLRLLVAGHRAAEAPGPLGLRREHPAQASADHRRMVSHAVYMFEKLLRDPELTTEQTAQVQARLSLARRQLQALDGSDPRRATLLRTQRRLGAMRRAVGLGARWYRRPPAVVTAAFGDLTALD